MIVLDTDMISLLDRNRGEGAANLVKRLSDPANDRVCATIISFEEQMRGWLSYISSSRTMGRQVEGYTRLHQLLDAYADREILDFDETATTVFERLRRGRLRVGTMDLKIAAICLAHDALLVSGNISDFAMVPGLRVEDWSKAR